jgi:hypothetical protein
METSVGVGAGAEVDAPPPPPQAASIDVKERITATIQLIFLILFPPFHIAMTCTLLRNGVSIISSWHHPYIKDSD